MKIQNLSLSVWLGWALVSIGSSGAKPIWAHDAAMKCTTPDAETLPRAEDDPDAEIAEATPTVKVGQAAPDFAFTDTEGVEWKLAALKGNQNVLLTFFPQCFTGGCANHLGSLRDVYTRLQTMDTQVLAISIDPSEGERGQKAFANQWNFPFPFLPDNQRQLSILFGAAQNQRQRSARMSILIDKKGIVRWIETDVNLNRHGADVVEKIRELKLAS